MRWIYPKGGAIAKRVFYRSTSYDRDWLGIIHSAPIYLDLACPSCKKEKEKLDISRWPHYRDTAMPHMDSVKACGGFFESEGQIKSSVYHLGTLQCETCQAGLLIVTGTPNDPATEKNLKLMVIFELDLSEDVT